VAAVLAAVRAEDRNVLTSPEPEGKRIADASAPPAAPGTASNPRTRLS
jgi:hypothetical protein